MTNKYYAIFLSFKVEAFLYCLFFKNANVAFISSEEIIPSFWTVTSECKFV